MAPSEQPWEHAEQVDVIARLVRCRTVRAHRCPLHSVETFLGLRQDDLHRAEIAVAFPVRSVKLGGVERNVALRSPSGWGLGRLWTRQQDFRHVWKRQTYLGFLWRGACGC